MHPILLDFGSFDLPLLGPTHLFLPTYGLFFAGGALLAWWWFLRRARTPGIAAETAFNLAFYTLLAGLAGAKLTWVAVDWRYYLANPGQIVGILRSAGVLLGDVHAGMMVFILSSRRQRLPLPAMGDAIAAWQAHEAAKIGAFVLGERIHWLPGVGLSRSAERPGLHPGRFVFRTLTLSPQAQERKELPGPGHLRTGGPSRGQLLRCTLSFYQLCIETCSRTHVDAGPTTTV